MRLSQPAVAQPQSKGVCLCRHFLLPNHKRAMLHDRETDVPQSAEHVRSVEVAVRDSGAPWCCRQFLDSPAVLGGKGSARQMHRSGSFLSQPISPLSTSPLPFSESESSESESLSGSRSRAPVSLTPVHNSNVTCSAATHSARAEVLGRAAARQAGGATAIAAAADSSQAAWKDQCVLHCTYTVGGAEHGRPLATMAWADADGELLHQVTEELPSHTAPGSSGGGQQEGIVLAWWCAERLIGATLDIMARSAAAGLQHVCVTLVLARDCEHWVWMHVPQLLAARLQGSAALAHQLKRITVLNVAIDDPTLIHQPQVRANVARAVGASLWCCMLCAMCHVPCIGLLPCASALLQLPVMLLPSFHI